MDFAIAVLATLLSLVAGLVVLAAAAGVVILVRGRPVALPSSYLHNTYTYTMLITGLLVLTMGIGELVRAGFAYGFGKDFSYDRVSVKPAEEPLHPLEEKQQSGQSLITSEQQEVQRVLRERQVRQSKLAVDVELGKALEVGQVRGAVFTVSGVVIWLAHLALATRLKTAEVRGSRFSQTHLVVGAVVFGVMVIFLLPWSVSDTYQSYATGYMTSTVSGVDAPGEGLALGLVSLPIWIVYLVQASRTFRQP